MEQTIRGSVSANNVIYLNAMYALYNIDLPISFQF